jgi:hypothetical protein
MNMSVPEFAWVIAINTWPFLLIGVIGTSLFFVDMKRWWQNRRKKVYRVEA